MSPKWNYIFGATTIALIVGGTIYAIVKSKQVEKLEEESISVEEAKDIVARRQNTTEDFFKNGLDLDGDVHDGKYVNADEIHFKADIDVVGDEKPRKIQGVKASLIVYDDEEEGEPDEDEDEPLHDDFAYLEDDVEGPSIDDSKDEDDDENMTKEDNVLRHHPNSTEARDQFIGMELADWHHDDEVYGTMLNLFNFPFVPTTDGDDTLKTQVMDYKVQFFGFDSRWNTDISFADIILHYARGAQFNCGETVAYWVEYFLDLNDFHWDSTSEQIDTLLLRLNSHTYFNDERQTFGLFGLTRESMDQAIKIANRNIDRSVTYEIEFNEFLKSCL